MMKIKVFWPNSKIFDPIIEQYLHWPSFGGLHTPQMLIFVQNLKFGHSYEGNKGILNEFKKGILAEFKNIWPNCGTVLTLAILRWFAQQTKSA